MQLSIIIPAFKVELYIERCLRTLEDQDLDKNSYEILVVNDGSPDRCPQIVEGLQKEFPNIRLFNQDNRGVSVARNRALEEARGEYVLPVDPDDFVAPLSLGRIVKFASARSLDMLYLGFDVQDVSGAVSWKTDYAANEDVVFPGREAYFVSRPPGAQDPDRSWGVLFSRQMLQKHNVKYPEHVPFLEDGLFVAKACTVADRVGFDPQIFYRRYSRPGSATNSRLFNQPRATKGFLLATELLCQYKESLTGKQVELINHCISKFTFLSLQSCISFSSFTSLSDTVKELHRIHDHQLDLKGCRSIYLDFGRLYAVSPWVLVVFLILRAVSIRVSLALGISRNSNHSQGN